MAGYGVGIGYGGDEEWLVVEGKSTRYANTLGRTFPRRSCARDVDSLLLTVITLNRFETVTRNTAI